MKELTELKFEAFTPLYGRSITIPINTLVWRGYNAKYPLSNRPAYFGSKSTAKAYGNTLGSFINIKPLRLLDIRFLKVILAQLINSNLELKTQQERNIVKAITVSFGLCSLGHQIKLMKHLYKDQVLPGLEKMEEVYNSNLIIEQPGVRVGEVECDAFTVSFLKGLLSDLIDGFISPRLESIFHVEKDGFMSQEMIIFNPIEFMQLRPTNFLMKEPTQITDFFDSPTISIKCPILETEIQISNIRKGGGHKVFREDYNTLIENGNKKIIKRYNDGLAFGSRLRYISHINNFHPKRPHAHSIFSANLEI